ncbi:TPA: hypothetical protein BOS_24916 [Bos taurus]|nr:TPA: hypothetical protein BOS_24916 [Bos taurus]
MGVQVGSGRESVTCDCLFMVVHVNLAEELPIVCMCVHGHARCVCCIPLHRVSSLDCVWEKGHIGWVPTAGRCLDAVGPNYIQQSEPRTWLVCLVKAILRVCPSRCCRDAAAGAAALTRGASSSERHRGGAGGPAGGRGRGRERERREAADAAGPGSANRRRRGGPGVLIPTLLLAPPEPGLPPPSSVGARNGGGAPLLPPGGSRHLGLCAPRPAAGSMAL